MPLPPSPPFESGADDVRARLDLLGIGDVGCWRCAIVCWASDALHALQNQSMVVSQKSQDGQRTGKFISNCLCWLPGDCPAGAA